MKIEILYFDQCPNYGPTAKLDVSSRQAVVTYDPAIQNVAALEKVISGAGFHIASGPHSS